MKIDLNRGVMLQFHADTGMQVFMYLDTPGEYLNAHGHPVSDEIAREAGFDVATHAKERERRARLAAASQIIDTELGLAAETQVVREQGGFRIVRMGAAGYSVLDAEGNKLNAVPLTQPLAEKLFEAMAPAEPALDLPGLGGRAKKGD